MDDDLKNSLLNIVSIYFSLDHQKINEKYSFSRNIITKLIKNRIENLDNYDLYKMAFDYYYNANWNNVYDFIEIYLEFIKDDIINFNQVCLSLNKVLEKENSAYRIINNIISPISNEYEINEVVNSLENTKYFTSLKYCNEHLSKSLLYFSDREEPDYRNSIKESISAIESLMITINNNKSKVFASAIDSLNQKLNLHKSLVEGFKKLYGYTSDNGGIRHALTEDSLKTDFDDAKYMLITCSAFINYIIAKCTNSGIELK